MGSMLSRKSRDVPAEESRLKTYLDPATLASTNSAIDDKNASSDDTDLLQGCADELIQKIAILDGLQAEKEQELDETTAILDDALDGGNAVAAAVLNKSVVNFKNGIVTLNENRLRLEIELYEIKGRIIEKEDLKYSKMLCSAIDNSQQMGFPLLAVRLTWLIALESHLKERYPHQVSKEFTMSFLSSTYVQDETQKSGMSLCDHFISEGEGKLVGLATHYVVYSQTMLLSDFNESLERSFFQNGMTTPESLQHIYIWVDIFSFPQDSDMLRSINVGGNSSWYQLHLAPALSFIAKAIVILDHANRNPVLKSSWALMELFLISTNSEIHVEITMSYKNTKLLIDDASLKGTRRVFPQISKLSESSSSIPGKKDQLTEALGTFSSNETDFYEAIKVEIDTLMSNYLYSLIASFKNADVPFTSLVSSVVAEFCQVRCLYDESEQAFKYALRLARQQYGNLDPRTIRVVKKMIKFYEVTGEFDKAEDLRNFGKPNRDKGGDNMVTLRGADIQVISRSATN
jgi:hypothetical protein